MNQPPEERPPDIEHPISVNADVLHCSSYGGHADSCIDVGCVASGSWSRSCRSGAMHAAAGAACRWQPASRYCSCMPAPSPSPQASSSSLMSSIRSGMRLGYYTHCPNIREFRQHLQGSQAGGGVDTCPATAIPFVSSALRGRLAWAAAGLHSHLQLMWLGWWQGGGAQQECSDCAADSVTSQPEEGGFVGQPADPASWRLLSLYCSGAPQPSP